MIDFDERCIPVPEAGCRLWLGGLSDGYGSVYVDGQMRGAHCVAWEQANGPIPPGMYVLHKCDVRCCTELIHLFLGTHADNMADMATKGRASRLLGDDNPRRQHPERWSKERAARGESHGRSKLVASQVLDIRARVAAGESQHSVARHYGISQPTVHLIVVRKHWSHLP